MTTSAEIQAKVVKLEINMDRLDGIVNGSNTATVTIDGAQVVPSVSKAIKDSIQDPGVEAIASFISTAEDSQGAINTAVELAQNFANAPEDEVVADGLYSARHWATKAAAADAVSGATAARDIAVAASDIAVAAAASIDVLPITANTMLVDNSAGDAREAKTFAEVRNLLDPLKDFYADGSSDDTANWTTFRNSYPDLDVDGKGKEFRVTSIPEGPCHNGYWVLYNYEGDLTARIPFRDTLPFVKVTIDATPGHNSWPEDNFSYSEGERVGSFTASGHGSGGRFVGKSISGSTDHWTKAVPDFGRNKNDSPNGFYNNGGMVYGGAEFQLKRRQGAGASYPNDHRVYARNRHRRREFTDLVRSVSGTSRFRIYKSTVTFEVMENTTCEVITTSAVGGVTINGMVTCNGNNSLFMEFTMPSGTFTSTEEGGGFTQLIVPSSAFSERTFTGGNSFGEQLVANTGDDGLLVHQPAVALGMTHIPSDRTGAAYTTVGSSYGIYIVKMQNLFAGNNEATLGLVKKIASWATYAEPCLAVSQTDEDVVVVGLRSDNPAQPPAFAVTTDAFATISTPIPMSTTGGWGLDNNIPVASFVDVGGEEHFFLALTGNRGGDGSSEGWTKIPVYIMHATKTAIIAAASSGINPFKAYAIGSVDWVDMWSDTGSSGRSGVGVGSLMALPGGVLNYVCGDMKRTGSDGSPVCHIASFKFDVSTFLGLPPADLSETADCATGQVAVWQGITGSDIGPSSDIVLANYVVETAQDGISTAGIFTAKETGWYRCDVFLQISGNASDQTVSVYDVATGAALAQPAHTSDLNSTIYVLRATLPTGLNMSVSGFAVMYLRSGQQVKLRTGANTTIKVTATTNFIAWSRMA